MLVAMALALMVAQSEPSDWLGPPAAVRDAGQDPDADWRPPPGQAENVYPQPPPASAKVEEVKRPPAEDAPAPDPKRFSWGHFALAVMGLGGDSGYFAARVEAGAVLGWPRRISGTANRAMGLTIGVAGELLAAKLGISYCGNSSLCGSRLQAGGALRIAWIWGVIGTDAIVVPIHSVFFQAVGFGSSNSVPSAPLSPGSKWGEHGLRFDLGLITGILRGSLWPRPGAFVLGGGLYFALSLEWLIARPEDTGRFRAGASVGLGI